MKLYLPKSFYNPIGLDWKMKRMPTIDDCPVKKLLKVSGHFKDSDIAISNLFKVLKYAFWLPDTSAPVERVLERWPWDYETGLQKSQKS